MSFAYGADADLVLHDVTLHIAPGERMALVGATGAGKSTLAKLLARFYDPIEGAVTVGGADLRDITFASLRRTMCVVPQEGYLFAGSLRDNIRVGRVDASDADVDAAIAALGVGHHFDSFPDGLDTEVQEGGARLSAGERQIVSLARAALADPGVLVLDEATSNLDPGTEHEVEQALERLMSGRTVIVVAHRLSTAARADPHRGDRRRRSRRARHPRRAHCTRRPLRLLVRRLANPPHRRVTTAARQSRYRQLR